MRQRGGVTATPLRTWRDVEARRGALQRSNGMAMARILMWWCSWGHRGVAVRW
jgi:hypothetical protein